MRLRLYAVPLFALMLLPMAHADLGGSSAEPADPDVAAALQAIEAKNWTRAVELLTGAAARDDKNAGIHNMLGYAERKRGNLDAAFRHYERALALDPKHRGAHEYIGEAYLMAGNLAKAEEHLATLDKLCFFPCEQYTDLKAAIAAYKQKQPK
jgi:Flp pilus assembly protein TadD